jgi:hypothetical protein
MKGALPIGLAMLIGNWPASALDYEKDIMPIFVEKCSDCHSEKAEKIKGGLRLDNPEHFQKRFAKNDVVIPGDYDASYLFVTLFRPPEDEEAMPPKGKGERLTVEEIVLVLEWIAEGAPINGERGDRGPKPENYEALFADLGTRPGPMVGEEKAVEEEWTNLEGATITATLIRVEDDEALFRMKDGRVTRYPVAKLSEESRARIASRETPKP